MTADILILGSGMVSKPLIEYFLKHEFNIIVASNDISKAEKLIKDSKSSCVLLDIEKDDELLEKLISQVQLVISILPHYYHVKIAKICIRNKKHMTTASYVSKEMKELESEVLNADITILNEIGVDPGIDHMSAMKIIDGVKNNNGKIVSFKSYCGGLPAPDSNNNPFNYKFSWSPKGVVLAAKNPGLWKHNDKIIEIKEGSLFKKDHIGLLNINKDNLNELEVYTNRDSLQYEKIYGLEHVKTMFRGTLRYKGWCRTWDMLTELGLLDSSLRSDLQGLTYLRFMSKILSADDTKIRQFITNKLNINVDDPVINQLEWLGLFSEEKISLKSNQFSILDVLVNLLEKKLQYNSNERDMLVMVHEFLVEYANGRKNKIISTLIDYGFPNGDSSMSRTVALPLAISSRLLLENKISVRGIVIPTIKEIYEPVLDELKTYNIALEEEIIEL